MNGIRSKMDDPSFDLSTVWKYPLTHRPPVTENTIARAESFWGVKLPETYLRLLNTHNGGATRQFLPGSVQSAIWGLPDGTDHDLKDRTLYGRLDMCMTKEEIADFGVEDNARQVITLDGDGHWFLCLDYRKNGPNAEPEIALIDIEGTYIIETVAPSFDAFLAKLAYDFGGATVAVTATDPNEVHDRIANECGLTFDHYNDGFDGWHVRGKAINSPRIQANAAHMFKKTLYEGSGPASAQRPVTTAWGEMRARFPEAPLHGTEISWVEGRDAPIESPVLKQLFPDLAVIYTPPNDLSA